MDDYNPQNEVQDQDLIQLLNAKKKNREILAITNAAVDAVSTLQHTQDKNRKGFSSKFNEESKENNDSINVNTTLGSDSIASTSTNNASFSGKHRVRVPSRLLREIRSPFERSNLGKENSTSDSERMSSSSLFTSQSSNQSSVQATGPIPTVIKYSSVPPKSVDLLGAGFHQNTAYKSSTPVVVKYSQEYACETPTAVTCVDTASTKERSSLPVSRGETHVGQKHSMCSTSHKITPSCYTMSQTGCDVNAHKELRKKNNAASETKSTLKMNIERDNEYLKDKEARKISGTGGSVKHHDHFAGEAPETQGAGLCQGALSSTLLHALGPEKGQVKALSFSVSERERATREMLSKRQEKPVVRRIVQPKIVLAETVKEVASEVQPNKSPEVNPNTMSQENLQVVASQSSIPVMQLPSMFENQMKSLMSTLGTIETQCLENRARQELQQKELEMSLKQRDERRLQNLEDIQKQLLECQLKYGHSAAPAITKTSTTHITTDGLSSTQELPRPGPLQAGTSLMNGGLVQGAPAGNPGYTPAVQHQAQTSFQTSVYNKPQDVKVHPGLKRKFVRNTRTQTSPQDSSSGSFSGMTSPLATPLPRKDLPVPMSRDSKSHRKSVQKQVRFDSPGVSNPKKFVKRDITSSPEGITYPLSMGDDVQTRYRQESQDFERRNTSPVRRSEDSDYIVNDIGKLRQELRDALKETKRTKLSLKNLHDNIHSQISDEDILVPPDHTQPYPLDAYLRATRDLPDESETSSEQIYTLSASREKSLPDPSHYADAACVLRDVQRRKETLESNLVSMTRQHEEQHLYRLVGDLSTEGTTSEALRIRKEVAKKIEEIGTVVQLELQDDEQKRLALETETSAQQAKMAKTGARSSHGVPLSTEKRAKTRNTGKENQTRAKAVSKAKTGKAVVAKQPPVKRPLEEQSYVSRVYGRPDHVARRTTMKSSYRPYQSPAVPPARDELKSRQRWNDSVTSLSSDDDARVPRSASRKPKYYFEPCLGTGQALIVKTHFKGGIEAPVPGQLLSMAIPLGKPKKDPSLRLPVNISRDVSASPDVESRAVQSCVKQPNVAVISIKDENCLTEDKRPKKPRKHTRGRKKLTLERQVLPNVDIDTSSVSEVSEEALPVKKGSPQILPCTDPVPRPAASEYQEFKDYEGVKNLDENDQDNGEASLLDGEGVISLHGSSRARETLYQGPAFPPQSIPANSFSQGGLTEAVIDERATSKALESKAVEWIEQELLARVVSEMVPPPPDPTAAFNRGRSSSTPSVHTDNGTEPDLLAAIGLRGMQLFVDAGIPVDHDLVQNLIVEVLREKISTMIGYPKPQVEPSTQEKSVEDYTEPESGSEEQTLIETPVRTPSETSPPVTGSPPHISTPEESDALESSSSLLLSDDVTKNVTVVAVQDHATRDEDTKADEFEEGPLEDSVPGSPVATPVATPSPRHSIIQLCTPEVSEQDLADTAKTGIDTPTITVSAPDKTSESAQELEDDDLKEQTFTEDASEQEGKEPGAEISAVKFELSSVSNEVKVTNSPSSITTTTTYSTHSTMGTVATDDEISEGEQLQPFVHVGQYSEGEFAAPSAVVHAPDNMATMREIPDDILGSFDITGKRQDIFRHVVSGLLGSDKEPEESSGATEDTFSSEAQQRLPSETLLSQGSLQDVSRSEGEVAVSRDVVAALLTKIRSRPQSQRNELGIQDGASAGELEERGEPTALSWRGLSRLASEGDVSPGEVTRRLHKPAVGEEVSEQRLNHPPESSTDRPRGSSVFDSDENNNESERSGSLNDVQNQRWNANDMVTPLKKTSSLLRPSDEHPEAMGATALPRVVHVTEAPKESTPARLLEEEGEPGLGNVTMETLSAIGDSPLVEHVSPEPPRIQLSLPFAEANVSPSVSEGLLLVDPEDTTGGDASSLSGGEIP